MSNYSGVFDAFLSSVLEVRSYDLMQACSMFSEQHNQETFRINNPKNVHPILAAGSIALELITENLIIVTEHSETNTDGSFY